VNEEEEREAVRFDGYDGHENDLYWTLDCFDSHADDEYLLE